MLESLSLDNDQLSLLAPRINAIVDEAEIKGQLILEERVSVLELLKHFPNDRDEILAIRVNEERPTGAFISKGRNWREFNKFRHFQEALKPQFRNEASGPNKEPATI